MASPLPAPKRSGFTRGPVSAGTLDPPLVLPLMGKFGWAVMGVLVAAYVADQYWNHGYYTDGALAMLRHIRHSFGW